MSLISQSIPNLFNGVSQQPASLRNASQAEVQENAYPEIATGLRKRNPTFHKAKLRSSAVGGAFVHMINRDTTERYVVVVLNGDLEVYDLSGNQKTVLFPNGKTYLSSATPNKGFSLVTVADYTFVVNKSKVAQMLPAAAPATPVNVGYVYVASAPALHNFSITVDGIKVTVSQDASGGTQESLSANLAASLNANATIAAGYTVTSILSSIVKIVKNSGGAVSVSSADSFGNQALRVLSNGVPKYSDLPLKFETGYSVNVKAAPGDASTGYWVEFKNNGWVETVKPGALTSLDPSTLPHKLVRNADGTFTFGYTDWATRKVGDDDSNPPPSFIGRTIRDIFFFRNRLGMVSDENALLSRAGDFFNFFGQTALSVLDSDPIDISASHTKVSIFNHAIPFNTALMLFSDQTQFQLTAGDALTPKSVKIDAVTEFESSSDCRPVALGQELFFAVQKENFTGVREYYVDATTISNDAADVTAHVPTYIPSGVFKMSAASGQDTVMALSENEPNALYVYKFYWTQNEKVQSAWFRFVFDPADTVLSMEFLSNVCYLVIQRADGIYLESLSLQPNAIDDGLPYQALLDRRVTLTGAYDPVNDWTTWTLPYEESAAMSVILGPSFSGSAGGSVNVSRPSSTTIRATGDYSAGPCIIGRNYTMRYRLSEQFTKDDKGISISGAKVKMRRMRVRFEKSGYFRAEVTPPERETFVYPYTGKYLGSSRLLLGQVPIESATFAFPILSGTENLVIELLNDSHLPSIFQSIEWDGEVTIKAARR